MKNFSFYKDVLFELFLYLDPIPFNKLGEEILTDPVFWKRRLEVDRYTVINTDIDYKKLYEYYTKYDDDKYRALRACDNSDDQIVLELAEEIDNFDYINCLSRMSILSSPEKYAELLVAHNILCAAINNPEININIKKQLIDNIDNELIVKCIDTTIDARIVRLLDDKCIKLDYTMLQYFDLPNNLSRYIKLNQITINNYQQVLQNSVRKKYNRMLYVLLDKFNPTNAQLLLLIAVNYSNYAGIRLILNYDIQIDGSNALTIAIKKNDIASVTILKSFVNQQHIKIAKTLNYADIYNILISL